MAQRPADPAVEAELERLERASIAELRRQWRDLFRSEPPKAFGSDLLRRSLAQRIQQRAYGGLAPAAQRLLDRLMKTTGSRLNGRIELPQRIKTGAVLVRGWKGKTYRVTILEEGFAYDGTTYQSLSEIARIISGTRWNGPRFFGLRVPTSSERDEKRKPKSKAISTARDVTVNET